MEQIKSFLILMVVVVTLCCTGMTAYAQQMEESSILSVSDGVSFPVEEEDSKDLPEVEVLEGTNENAPGNTASSEALLQEPVEEAGTEQQASDNTPYFVGAGIAVLVFVGVAVFCKIKGKN